MHADIKQRYLDLLGYDNEIILLGTDNEHLDLSNREIKNEEFFHSTITRVYQELFNKDLIEGTGIFCFICEWQTY